MINEYTKFLEENPNTYCTYEQWVQYSENNINIPAHGNMNRIDTEYQDLLAYILGNGVEKKDRTGTGTLSVFGWQIRHNMKEGFPLLTTKKMAWKSIVTELLWFLRGDTNIKYLVDNDCHIWDGDAYKNYVNEIKLQNNWEVTLRVMDINTIGQQELLSKEEFINKIKTDDEFAKQWGELGPIYGKQWRSWTKYEEEWHQPHHEIQIDQIANLISELKTNPDSRRLMVNAWNCSDLDSMVLPPCHYGFQVYTRELTIQERFELAKFDWPPGGLPNMGIQRLDELHIPKRAISLMWNQRSVDTFLGLPFNIASYGLLLEIIAKQVNMVPDELIGNLGDVHLYSNHVEQAKEQIGREPYPLPILKIREDIIEHGHEDIDPIPWYSTSDFTLENYQSHPSIKAPLSN